MICPSELEGLLLMDDMFCPYELEGSLLGPYAADISLTDITLMYNVMDILLYLL